VNAVGIGLDLCPVERMERAVSRHGDRLLARIFTDAEKAYCRDKARPAESLAARFAAKEATSKALGAPAGIAWHDVEVVPAVTGVAGPKVVLRGRAAEVAESLGAADVLLSITHAGGVAAAVAAVIR
jgi:holo-[acyl-carrier protein] synthase